MPARATGPLAGVKVVELSHIMAGPVCGLMLADLGADVVKVERLPAGDDARRMVPPTVGGESAAFLMMNRNKRGIALDLRRPEAIAAVRRLASRADVLRTLGLPVKLSATPGGVHRGAPILGEHTREVLAEHGYDGAEIDALVASGAALDGALRDATPPGRTTP